MVERYLLSMTRGSVAAGDDVLAPHKTVLSVSPQATALEVCREIQGLGYLASIAGGLATWLVYLDGKPIGVIAQQWERPKPLRQDIPLRQNSVIHCAYHVQQEPNGVFTKYQNSMAE